MCVKHITPRSLSCPWPCEVLVFSGRKLKFFLHRTSFKCIVFNSPLPQKKSWCLSNLRKLRSADVALIGGLILWSTRCRLLCFVSQYWLSIFATFEMLHFLNPTCHKLSHFRVADHPARRFKGGAWTDVFRRSWTGQRHISFIGEAILRLRRSPRSWIAAGDFV